MEKQIEKLNIEQLNVDIKLIQKDTEYIKLGLEDTKNNINLIKNKLENRYISRDEFAPIKSIVYGLVGLILTGVVGALIALILK